MNTTHDTTQKTPDAVDTAGVSCVGQTTPPAFSQTPIIPSDTMQVLSELGEVLGRIKMRMDAEGYEVVEGCVVRKE